MHFSLGDNFGRLIIGIAQDNIEKLNFSKAISTFTDSFPGMSEELATKILKNEYVIIPQVDGTITLSDEIKDIEANKKYIHDWDFVIKNKCEKIQETLKCIAGLFNAKKNELYTLRCDFNDLFLRKINYDQIILDIFKGKTNEEYDKLSQRVLEDDYDDEDHAMHCITYLYNIVILQRDLFAMMKLNEFLESKELVGHVQFYEDYVERAMNRLIEFTKNCKFNFGFNYVLQDFKEKIYDDIKESKLGAEYFKYNQCIRKNIMDGYDAGWLSPEGDFFALNGETNELIHCNIAERLEKVLDLKYNPSFGGIDYKLTVNGWMKIHNEEVYGYFKHDKQDDTRALFAPTDTQINLIAKYVDKYHGGVFLNSPAIVGGKEIKTSRLRQADEFQLHKIFCEY